MKIQTNKNQKFKKIIEFVLFWPTTSEHLLIPSNSPLEMTEVSLDKWSSVTSSFLVREAHRSHFLFSVLGHHLARSYEGLGCAATVSISSYVHMPVMFGRHCFLITICHLWLLKYFCLFFPIDS